jgi:hypothetical protein
MKKVIYLFASIFMLGATLTSCDSDDEGGNTPDPDPTPLYTELSGNLTTQTLTKDKKYLIKGQTFVRTGQVLTIQPGTVIFGDKATKGTLIIDRGGKLEASGTAAEPIVFTSSLAPGTRDRGDWGGLVILGKANVNQDNPAI